jgi:hypothetical protein
LPRQFWCFLALGLTAIGLLTCIRQREAFAADVTQGSSATSFKHSEPPNSPSLAERRQMSNATRLRCLEKLGRVPEDADPHDWSLAQHTSWWGKPIDPKDFWKNKVIWLDSPAQMEAQRHGRGYPPAPYDDPSLPNYKDEPPSQGGQGEGPQILTVISARESAFWDKFQKTHPVPPDKIQADQEKYGRILLQQASRLGNDLPSAMNNQEVQMAHEAVRRSLERLGYPKEVISPEAIYWGYVEAKRQEFRANYSSAKPEDQPRIEVFLKSLPIKTEIITEQLTEQQIQAANAWKIAYLQRLRREKADESYVQAYLKAWNLSEEQVFAAGPK